MLGPLKSQWRCEGSPPSNALESLAQGPSVPTPAMLPMTAALHVPIASACSVGVSTCPTHRQATHGSLSPAQRVIVSMANNRVKRKHVHPLIVPLS